MAEAKKVAPLGFLRGLFMEDVPDASRMQSAPVASTPSTLPPPRPVSSTSEITPDPKALASLEATLTESVPAVYTSFMEQYELLRDVVHDDTMRLKAAMKTSKTSVDQLAEALTTMLGAMDGAKQHFEKDFDERKTKVLSSAKEQITATEELIHSREQQLKAIQEEITSLRSKRDNVEQQMQNDENRLEVVRKGFEAAHAQVVSRLAAQRTHIASQLKG